MQSEGKQVLQDLDVFFTFTQVGLPPDQQGQLCNPPLAMQVAKKNIFSYKETRFTYPLLLSLIPKVCILIQISTLFHLQPERKQVLQDFNVVFTFTQVGFPLDQQGQLRNPPLAMQVVKACFL